jgi:hypothetical protein
MFNAGISASVAFVIIDNNLNIFFSKVEKDSKMKALFK